MIKSYQPLAAAWSVEQFLDGSFGPEIGPSTKADNDELGASLKTEYAAMAAVKGTCISRDHIFLSRRGKKEVAVKSDFGAGPTCGIHAVGPCVLTQKHSSGLHTPLSAERLTIV